MNRTRLRGRAGIAWVLFMLILGSGGMGLWYLQSVYREREVEIERLQEVVERLEAESRLAQVIVKDRSYNPRTGRPDTTLKFVEVDREGKPLPARYFTVEGEIAYFDYLVIKFDHQYVELGDALRGKSICLFRRVFGENQAPENGIPIDGGHGAGVPDIYRISPDPDPFEIELWEKFWDYAADPAAAREKGVRVIQGEAVYTRFIPQNVYTLSLDHDGGLNILVEQVPAILRDELQRDG